MTLPSDIPNLYAWYDADLGRYDATTGGSSVTANRGVVKRHEDQSGNGRHLTQGTTGSAFVYDATKGLIVGEIGADGWFNLPASFTLSRVAMSFFAVVDISALRRSFTTGQKNFRFFLDANPSVGDPLYLLQEPTRLEFLQSGGFSFGETPLSPSRVLIGYTFGSTSAKIWLDGQSTNVAAAVAGSSTFITLFNSVVLGGPAQVGYKDVLVYSRELSDIEVVNTLVPWSQTRGVSATRLNQLVIDGDSIAMGFGCTLNQNWPAQLTLPETLRIRNLAECGDSIAAIKAASATRTFPLLVVGETNVFVIAAGGNDIASSVSSATVLADCLELAEAAEAAGFISVPCTIPKRTDITAGNETARIAFNTGLRAAWPTDQIIDWDADSRLDNTLDTVDGIHPTDARYAIMAEVAQEILDPLLTPPTVATNLSRGQTICYDRAGAVVEGIYITIEQLAGPGVAGSSYSGMQFLLRSDEEGIVSYSGFIRLAWYRAKRSGGRWTQAFQVPDADEFDLPETLGRP